MNNSFYSHSLTLVKKYLLLFFVVSFSVVLISTYYVVQYSLDSNLKQNASIVMSISNHELGEIDSNYHVQPMGSSDVLFQVFVDNKLTLHSKNAPDFKLMKGEGLETIKFTSEYWRVFHYEKSGLSLYIGEKLSKRYVILYWMMIYTTVIYIAFYIMVAYIVRRLIRSLTKKLSIGVEHIYEDKKVSDSDIIMELNPIMERIDAYKKELEKKNISEREFLEHVSHELRTPLAILKINIERAADFSELNKSYQKIENIITQFLLFSRGEKGLCVSHGIVEIITLVVEDILVVYPDIEIDFDIEKEFNINCNIELMKLAFSNFIVNAINKGSKSILIKVLDNNVIIQDFCHPIINIEDIGGGIGLLLAERVLNKVNAFYRLENNASGGVDVIIDFSKK